MDLRLLVQGVVALNRVAILERAALECELPELPLYVVADEGAMLQLLLNLISNAVHAVEPGRARESRISIRLGCEGEGEMVRLVVQDTGCGIAEDRLESIFQPLYSEGNDEGNDEGCGLGLSICKQVVEQLGGRIEVQSTVAVGTRFVVLLPSGE